LAELKIHKSTREKRLYNEKHCTFTVEIQNYKYTHRITGWNWKNKPPDNGIACLGAFVAQFTL